MEKIEIQRFSKECVQERENLNRQLQDVEKRSDTLSRDKTKCQEFFKSLAKMDLQFSSLIKQLYSKMNLTAPENESRKKILDSVSQG